MLTIINRQESDGLVQFKGDFLPAVGFRAPSAGSPAAAALAHAFARVDAFDTTRARAEADHDLTPEGRDRRCADAKAAAATAINEARDRIATLIRAREAGEVRLYEPPQPATASDVLIDIDVRTRVGAFDTTAMAALYGLMARGDENRVLLALVRDPLPNTIRERAAQIWGAVVERDHASEVATFARREEDEVRAEAAVEALAKAMGGIPTHGGIAPAEADMAARAAREKPVEYWMPGA